MQGWICAEAAGTAERATSTPELRGPTLATATCPGYLETLADMYLEVNEGAKRGVHGSSTGSRAMESSPPFEAPRRGAGLVHGHAAAEAAGERQRPELRPIAPSRPPRAVRAYSGLSEEAMAGLRRSAEELMVLEDRVEEIAFQLDCQSLTSGQARNELAHVEMQAKRLETQSVDAVYTSDLHSGKEAAKNAKKDQLARLESLFERLEVLFKKIRVAEA